MIGQRNVSRVTYPAGPKGSPVLGLTREFRRDPLGTVVNIRREFGDTASFRLGPQRVFMFNHPDAIHEILVAQTEKFQKNPALKANTTKSIGNGLLTSEGEFHKRQRKLVQPAFHAMRISAYGETMVDHTLRMLESWKPGTATDISREMMELTLSIVTKTLFDADVSDDADAIAHAITLGLETVNSRITKPIHLPDWLPTAKNIERREASAVLEKTIMRIIDERRKSGEDKGDLLSMLLIAADEDDGQHMTTKQVRDEAMTLFIAGHETTSNALSWTWYLLSRYPEVAQKLHAELDAVLGGRAPTMKDLPALPYTEKVIKESMRLYPPAWVMARQAAEPVTIHGVDLPRGAIALFSPYVMHRDPRYFDNPDEFIPERWTEDFEKTLPRYAYFPFGGGPRVCIGQSFALMEARLVLATIAQRFDLSLAPDANVIPQPLITLRAREGIKMQIAAREAQPAGR